MMPKMNGDKPSSYKESGTTTLFTLMVNPSICDHSVITISVYTKKALHHFMENNNRKRKSECSYSENC